MHGDNAAGAKLNLRIVAEDPRSQIQSLEHALEEGAPGEWNKTSWAEKGRVNGRGISTVSEAEEALSNMESSGGRSGLRRGMSTLSERAGSGGGSASMIVIAEGAGVCAQGLREVILHRRHNHDYIIADPYEQDDDGLGSKWEGCDP